MRVRASQIRSSFLPKVVASTGQTSAQAVGLPSFCRPAHMMHLPMMGTGLSHWYFGISKGQAIMQ